MTTVESPVASPPRPARRAGPWRAAVPAGLLILAPLPLLALHLRELWQRSHYQFFPVVPVGAAFLAVPACRGLGALQPGGRRGTVLAVGLAWTLLALASLLYSPWLGAVAALALLAAAAYGVGGGRLLRALLPALVFLGLVVPPPLGLDVDLIVLLQTLTSRAASAVLDAQGVYHVMEGNVVCVAGGEYMVEEACSGIHSLFVVLASTLFFVLWARRPPVRAVPLVAAGIVWVLLGNVARVVAVTYLGTRWGIDVTGGWRHETLGALVFVLTLGLLASTDCLLWFVPAAIRLVRSRMARRGLMGETAPEEPAKQAAWRVPVPALGPAPGGKPTTWPDLRRTWLAWWPAAAAFGLLAAVQVALFGQAIADVVSENVRTNPLIVNRFQQLKADDLPERSGPFTRGELSEVHREVGNAEGDFSKIWHYQFRGYQAQVSVDYPFKGFHELSRCYVARGWTLRGRRELRDESAPHVVEAKFEHRPGRYGFLLFANYDQWGNPLEPGGQVLGYLHQRVAAALLPWGHAVGAGRGKSSRELLLPSYQLQLFVESEYPLTAAEENQARVFFKELQPLVRRLGPAGAERGKS